MNTRGHRNADSMLRSNCIAGPPIGPMPLPATPGAVGLNSSGNRSWPVVYEYHTSGQTTSGSRRRPVLFRESLVGALQLNSSPDCGASGVKS